jgi:hypothetical protein
MACPGSVGKSAYASVEKWRKTPNAKVEAAQGQVMSGRGFREECA